VLRELTLGTIREARRRIAPYVLRTPVLHRRISPECELLLKPESLQSTGAFKLRGAFNLMLTLMGSGIVAHSSGITRRRSRAAPGARPAGGGGDAERCAELKRARTAADGARSWSSGRTATSVCGRRRRSRAPKDSCRCRRTIIR
jgi:hypothetical protein